ncbi:MAG: hemerythrin domain-containing protein, partial [Phycisphaerae bacterium]|nr:hemerythrin domain-containing protein [Phycisphaerae bacterium]
MHIPEIDVEHQRFIRLVNELNEAIIMRLNVEKIRERMQAIVDDAAAHFTHEEVLFREWGYPAAGKHAERHAEIMRTLREIMERFEHDGTEYEWIEAGLQVKQALIDHLLNEDMRYRDYRLGLVVQSGNARRSDNGP